MGVIYWMLTLRSSFEVSLSWSKYWRGISCWWIGKEGGDARNVYQGSLNEWEVERKDWFAILSNSKPHLMNDNLMHSVVYLTQMQILDPFRRWANSVLRTEYEYEYYLVLKNRPNTNMNIIRFENIDLIQIRILFVLKKSSKYEYEYKYLASTIRIIFKYRIIRSPLPVMRFIMTSFMGSLILISFGFKKIDRIRIQIKKNKRSNWARKVHELSMGESEGRHCPRSWSSILILDPDVASENSF